METYLVFGSISNEQTSRIVTVGVRAKSIDDARFKVETYVSHLGDNSCFNYICGCIMKDDELVIGDYDWREDIQ